MKKNNIRSIRFSDELSELIDHQVESSFTEKFKNLITRCVWELPQKEKQIKELDRLIAEKRKHLQETNLIYKEMINHTQKLKNNMRVLELEVYRAVEEWQKNNP